MKSTLNKQVNDKKKLYKKKSEKFMFSDFRAWDHKVGFITQRGVIMCFSDKILLNGDNKTNRV